MPPGQCKLLLHGSRFGHLLTQSSMQPGLAWPGLTGPTELQMARGSRAGHAKGQTGLSSPGLADLAGQPLTPSRLQREHAPQASDRSQVSRSAESAELGQGSFQELDQQHAVKPFCKFVGQARQPEEIAAVLQQALQVGGLSHSG